MMKFFSYWGIPISLTLYYLGLFFADLGGIGGYDGIAPRWLYEKSIYEEFPFLFETSEIVSILFLAAGTILGLFVLLLYMYMAGTIVYLKIKSLYKMSHRAASQQENTKARPRERHYSAWRVMIIFLRVKHWQLFLILIGSIFLTKAILSSFLQGGSISPNTLLILPTFILGLLFFAWLWAIASACSMALPTKLFSSPKPMQIGLVYALFYIALLGIVFGSTSELPAYLSFMHLLAMTAIFYSLGFTAKQLTKLDQDRKVNFFSYSGPFFLL
jgi:hypothetical protein